MNVVHIRRKIESETLHLPELRSLIGRTVEIVIHEAEPVSQQCSYDELFALAGTDAVDPQAYQQLRAASML